MLRLLPQGGLDERHTSFFHSNVILSNRFFIAAENILKLTDETNCVFGDYGEMGADGSLLIVRYPDAALAEEALVEFLTGYLPEADGSEPFQTESGNWTSAIRTNNYISVVFEAPSEAIVTELLSSFATSGYAHGIAINGNNAFVGGLYDGNFQIIDISDPTSPSETALLSHYWPNEAWDVIVEGELAYIVDHFSGLFVVDIADLTSPEVLGYHLTPAFLVDVAVHGDRLYSLGQERYGLAIVDFADPAAPHLLANTGGVRFPMGIAIRDTYAYVTHYSLVVADVADATEPQGIANVPVPGVARAVQIRGDYAYLTADHAGFHILDVSDTSAYAVTGSFEMTGFSYGLALSGDYAYVANSEYGLKIINIADPTSPTLVAALQTPDNAYAVEVSGTHVYIADGESGLQIVDVSDPTSPMIVGSIDLGGFINSVALSGDIAYVTDEDFGVRKLDISDPTHPLLIASYDTPGEPTDVAVVGDYVIVNDAFSLIVLR
ncbi:hypothetical protein ACFL3B_03955 [Gemmatimonadota bacterium]